MDFVGYIPNPFFSRSKPFGQATREVAALRDKRLPMATDKARDLEAERAGRASQRAAAGGVVLPARYSRTEIRAQSSVRFEEFDFSYYNRTRFAGLENDLPNCYCNALLQVSVLTVLRWMRIACIVLCAQRREIVTACPDWQTWGYLLDGNRLHPALDSWCRIAMHWFCCLAVLLQVLYFTPQFREAILEHSPEPDMEFCLSCEMLFLFRMMLTARGTPCRASNLLRALRQVRKAAGPMVHTLHFCVVQSALGSTRWCDALCACHEGSAGTLACVLPTQPTALNLAPLQIHQFDLTIVCCLVCLGARGCCSGLARGHRPARRR